ncbi:MAG: hypothetical protein ABSG33_06270 [Candidatus Bathyarchaeia archaeon]
MTQDKSPSKSTRLRLYAIAIICIGIILFAAVFLFATQKRPSTNPKTNLLSDTPPIHITLYEGEINATTYGFGTSATNLTSPGPQLSLAQDQAYTVTVYNIGTKPHNWAIIGAQWAPIVTNGALTPLKPISTTFVQFGAQIGTDADPIQPGSSGTVTFTITPDDVNQYPSLTYAYCSQVSQDANTFNMWGPIAVYSA